MLEGREEKRKAYGRAYYWKNREKRLAYNAKWYKENGVWRKKKDRRAWLKKKYGITGEQYDAMLIAQNYKCAICFKPHVESHCEKLGVDHNHTTKKVRALLCLQCNLMIGYSKEVPHILREGAKYLEKYNA